jgi:hypothetical protein
MIQRSQRRKPEKVASARPASLDLHERLARQRVWFLRLMTASALALAMSLVLWLVRVPLNWHLAGIALSFVAGLFVQRPMQTWAVAWIRERMGLSYETALEQGDSQDSFGFVESLKQRASEEASKLALPKYQAWWLPMLAVAFGFAFLPLIPRVAALPTGLTPPPTTATTANQQVANAPEPTAQEATPPSANEPAATAEGASPPPSTGETDASQLSDATGSGSRTSAQNNQSADEEALGRFLDNLKQREPPSSGSVDTDLSSVMPQGQQTSPSDENSASRPRNEQTNPFAQPGENQSSQAQNQSDNSSQEQGEEGQGEQAQGGQSQQAQSQNQGAEGEQASEGEGEQNQAQSASSQGLGEQTEGQQGQEGGDQSASAEGAGRQEGVDSGQNGEGAGNLPGTPTALLSEDIGSSQQNPEFLEGRITEGPNNTAGAVRLPGESEQTVFPEGSAPSSFSRAEEEALTEGRIPLEYQEVIRNYFRGNGQ